VRPVEEQEEKEGEEEEGEEEEGRYGGFIGGSSRTAIDLGRSTSFFILHVLLVM